jgi:hypothetical protein
LWAQNTIKMKREVRRIHCPLVYGRKRENQWYQSYQGSNVLHFFIISLKILSDLSTIQFRLTFKDKGHKSLEYCCLVIHLTSVISTISNAERNGGIFILIAPLGITNTLWNVYCEWFVKIRTASDLSTMQFRLIFKGHKSLEYWCLVIHLTSVSTISYAESNGVAFFSKYKAAHAVSMSKFLVKLFNFPEFSSKCRVIYG